MMKFRIECWGGPQDGFERYQDSTPVEEMYFAAHDSKSHADLYVLDSVEGENYKYVYDGLVSIP